MAGYDTLKNKQQELIRKALDGSVFVADLDADPITDLTVPTTLTAGKVDGSTAAVNIVTSGNLVLSINDGGNQTVALLTADTPTAVFGKINTVLGASATASLVGGVLRIQSAATGLASKVKVISGTGSVLADLKLTAGQEGIGTAVGVGLSPLPAGWDDLGHLTDDGAQFSRDVSASEVSSWGSVTPTRTDVTSDQSSLTVVAQETKLLTLGMATGADLANILADAATGEVSIAKPSRPKSKHYRVLSLAVDEGEAGEIYVARFLPRAKVSSYAEQSFSKGDDPITWGTTMVGEEDSTLGYSERWIFGGPGWKALLTQMGIENAP